MFLVIILSGFPLMCRWVRRLKGRWMVFFALLVVVSTI